MSTTKSAPKPNADKPAENADDKAKKKAAPAPPPRPTEETPEDRAARFMGGDVQVKGGNTTIL